MPRATFTVLTQEQTNEAIKVATRWALIVSVPISVLISLLFVLLA